MELPEDRIPRETPSCNQKLLRDTLLYIYIYIYIFIFFPLTRLLLQMLQSDLATLLAIYSSIYT